MFPDFLVFILILVVFDQINKHNVFIYYNEQILS